MMFNVCVRECKNQKNSKINYLKKQKSKQIVFFGVKMR